MADNGIILRTEGLVAGYGATTILHGTSVAVHKARITTIIGPNGAGKSTLFRAIFGLLPAREGRITLAGDDITGARPQALLRRGLAYVPQGRNLFGELSVTENLELGGVSLNSITLTRQRMKGVFERFPALALRADAQASTLSGGEQKMLEVGRALLLEPKVLMIDEPSIGLSPKLVGEVFALLTGLRDAGVTVLMVEQNARAALAISDDALVLQQGQLALAGKASDILDHPDIGSLFLGSGLKRT